MNLNDTLYTLNTTEDIFNFNAILSSQDTEFIPSYDTLPGLVLMSYSLSSFDNCEFEKFNNQTCEERTRQLWVLGYI